jgi:hypothetical protein
MSRKPDKRHEDLKERVRVIDNDGENLIDWEIDFIANLIDNPPSYYSEKQEDIIERIYRQRVK